MTLNRKDPVPSQVDGPATPNAIRHVFDGAYLWSIRAEAPWWDAERGPSLVFENNACGQFRVRDFPPDWMYFGTRDLVALCPLLARRYVEAFGLAPRSASIADQKPD